MNQLPFQTGEQFADRYEIVRCIASGGMGAVYEAIHTVTGRRCAVKVMLGHTVGRDELRKRFLQESQVAAQIGSQHIVDVLDAGVDTETNAPFLVMELLTGEDLGKRIARLGALPFESVVTFLWQASLALDKTHEANIVHRDLKASNLFLTFRDDGSPLVKVLDFGVAKVLPLEATSEGATQTIGTPIYMAPEQFTPDGRVSPASDIYSLGMLAYTLLVGAHYWLTEHQRCENPFAFASIAVHGPSESPVERAGRRRVTLPAGFDEWFFHATAMDPTLRFSSATGAIIALAKVLGEDAPEYPSGWYSPPEVPDYSKSNPHLLMPETMSGTSSGDTTDITEPSRPSHPAPGPEGVEEGNTEVSLSVTSGGLLVDPPPNRKPLLTAVVAAILLSLGGYLLTRDTNIPAANTGPSTLSSSRAPAAAPAVPRADPPTAVAPPAPSPIQIDELPPAEVVQPEPVRAKTPRRVKPKPATPRRTAPVAPAPPSPAAPDDMWGR